VLSITEFVLIGLAAVGAGLANALAGGGTLITFPTLIAVGIPPIAANVTNTVALCPGYFGATLAQKNDLQGQRRRMWILLPVAALGGVIGGLLLLNTGERVFRQLVPFLILLASGLLAIQDPVRAWLLRRAKQNGGRPSLRAGFLPVGLAAIYGHGAGLSVIILAALGLLDDTLTRLNALKQSVSLSVNVAAAILFAFSGRVVWAAVLVMAVGALIGGALGGRLAGRIKPSVLRWLVVGIGFAIGIIYLLRL
jgi:uncharacterized membrane protein YfcA